MTPKELITCLENEIMMLEIEASDAQAFINGCEYMIQLIRDYYDPRRK